MPQPPSLALSALAATIILAGCGKDPGKEFFALEDELLDQLEPHYDDPDKARAALCKWFREHGARIRRTHDVYSTYLKRLKAAPDPLVSASLNAMQEAQAARFRRVYYPLLDNERFFAAAIWLDSPESTDLDKVCAP